VYAKHRENRSGDGVGRDTAEGRNNLDPS
jgi:hypothetical protein